MYLIREIMFCKPGKVRPMVEKFIAMSKIGEMGQMDQATTIFDRDGGRWVSAHQDTVRAWHVVPEGNGGSVLTGWVDAGLAGSGAISRPRTAARTTSSRTSERRRRAIRAGSRSRRAHRGGRPRPAPS